MNNPIKIVLTIEAVIHPNGEDLETIRERFAHIASNAAGDGLMTGNGPAEVECWDSWVVDRPAGTDCRGYATI